MAPEKLSAFEARRQANVLNNAKLLKDTAEIGASMRRAAKPPQKPVTAPRKRKAAESVQRTRVMPTRRSARHSGVADIELDSFQMLNKNETPEPQAKQAKKARTAGDVKLEALLLEGKSWANSSSTLASFSQGAQPGVRTFTDDEIEDTKDETLKELRKGMSELELYDGWQVNDIKLTPERIYALTFHPIQDKPLIFAGDKKGNMGVFDASQEKPNIGDDDEDAEIPLPKVTAFEMHPRTISSIIAPIADPNSVITASYDSSIRVLDLPTQVTSQLWAPASNDEDVEITCVDVSPVQKDVVVFSTMSGSLGRFDRRTPKAEAEIWGLCDNKIGGFALNPSAPHFVATASLDRTLKLWDLRMIKGKGDMRHPYILAEHTSRLSVSHVSWSKKGYIATSSYDDTIKVYDMAESLQDLKPGKDLPDLEPVHKIKHNNQTGRWVTILKPKWQINPADHVEKFAIANMNRYVDIYDSQGNQLAQLEGEGITAVPAVAELHPSRNWVAGGSASGKLSLWM